MRDSKKLTLTIVIPVYNEQGYLPDCLASIAAQSVPPDEVIVVDNNSTDKSAGTASAFKFVKVIKEPKRGIVYARDTGFNAATSDLIARIDADSLLPADWVENIKAAYALAGAPEYFAATGPADFRNSGPGWLWFWLHRLTYFWAGYLLLGHYPLFGANMFLTKKLWEDIKKDVCIDPSQHEDMDLAYHIAAAGVKIHFIKDNKDSVLARGMLRKSFYYPLMMVRSGRRAHRFSDD